MENSRTEEIKEKISEWWDYLVKKSDEDDIALLGRERIIVFIVSLILALCLWLMVNLSVDYNLNIDIPIQIRSVPTDKALVEELPETATVSVSAEGWQLINLYSNPPSINIDVNKSEVNLYDQAQQQMNAFGVEIQTIQPSILTVELEDRVSKKVPVRSSVELSFAQQFGMVDSARIKPDSISINGAASLIEEIEEWSTDSVHIGHISGDLSRRIPLQQPGELIQLSQSEVIYEINVAQFTEGEVKVDVSTRNFPQDRMISFSPPSITIRYDIPIEEYNDVQDESPFNAYIDYSQIMEDSSGFVTPQIEQAVDDYHIKVRSFHPRRIAYFTILGNSSE